MITVFLTSFRKLTNRLYRPRRPFVGFGIVDGFVMLRATLEASAKWPCAGQPTSTYVVSGTELVTRTAWRICWSGDYGFTTVLHARLSVPPAITGATSNRLPQSCCVTVTDIC